MPSNTSQGREDQTERTSHSAHWLPPGVGEEIPPQVPRRPASKGLLSGWKASQLQANGGDVSSPIAERTTITMPALQGPITGAIRGNALPQNFREGQVAPRPLPSAPPAIFPAGQSYPGLASPPPPLQVPQAGPPRAQPAYPPLAARPSQPLMPFATQVQANNWQAASFQGSQWGQPPLVGPLPGQERKKKRRFPIWARVALGLLVVLLVLLGSGIYYYASNFAAPVSNIVNQQAPLLKGQDNPNTNQNTTSPLSGGRINILLLGSDTDAKFQGSYPLAQTDIVVTIDPTTKAVGMLSIPRDLYVNAPGYGMMKLDEIYATGAKYLHNAVGLSRAAITQAFGIPINYYAWVGLSGFMKVVDTAGGVDIDVTHPVTDDVYPDDTGGSRDIYAYKRLYIEPGPQHLDGHHALEYVRSRHADLVGDFGRSARQQQVLSQLKSRLTNSPDIISKLPQLAQDMNGFLKTDMNLLSITQLMYFARTLDPNKIQRVILSPPTYSYAAKATSGVDSGEDIFLANCAPIQQAVAKMFALGSKATCNLQANSHNPGTSVATKTAPAQPWGPVLQAAPSGSWPAATQLAGMSLGDKSGGDLLGIRSLLDLLCLVAFESPVGLQA